MTTHYTAKRPRMSVAPSIAIKKHPSAHTKQAASTFRLLETPDAGMGLLLAAKMIRMGLKNGETVVIVSPEKPEYLIRKLEMTGMNVAAPFAKSKLLIFNSQPALAGNLSLSTNYQDVFGEIVNLANKPIDRMVLMGMDVLVNLESQYLAYASVSKFTQAAEEMGCNVIAQYSRNTSKAHDRLDAACSSLVNNYFVATRGQRKRYQLQAKHAAA